ncbi:UNVERIFIED_CONTAM: hypothetical protein GTU68_065296 [Idotea baltica]|nr:hypothetical protein [Idotea baltica]
MNAAAENLLRQSRERILNKSFKTLFSQELNKSDLLFAIEYVTKNNEPHVIRGVNLHNKQDRITTVDCIANPIVNNGELVGIVLELSRTDHQLKIAKEEQLKIQQEATHKLVRGMAHEIKNPLGGVRGAAQLLESELQDEALKEYTTIIIAEADRLQNLVDRMLGKREPNKNQPTNIHEVLERVRRLVKADIPKNVRLTFDYDPSIPEFNADLDNLIQIVLNIVVNALKAVGENGNILFKTRIMRNQIINHQQHKLSLRLDIKDDGAGVPDDIRDKVFFPMISGSTFGTGLGLSIAQSLAQRQNGVIKFQSQPGDTTFTLSLPIDSI